MNRPERENRDLFAIADLAARVRHLDPGYPLLREQGPAASPSASARTRVFRRRDRARLILILRGKRLGFSLRDISDYLSLYDADRTQKAQVSLLVEMVDERHEPAASSSWPISRPRSPSCGEIRKLAGERLAQAA